MRIAQTLGARHGEPTLQFICVGSSTREVGLRIKQAWERHQVWSFSVTSPIVLDVASFSQPVLVQYGHFCSSWSRKNSSSSLLMEIAVIRYLG